jgi:F0F1-type ATP synthase assembly protein I
MTAEDKRRVRLAAGVVICLTLAALLLGVVPTSPLEVIVLLLAWCVAWYASFLMVLGKD